MEKEMTDTKPNLDEQIEDQRLLVNKQHLVNQSDRVNELERGKLASLEELKRIQSAEMPEPVAWRVEDEGATWDYRTDEPSQEDIDWAARWERKYQPLYGPELLAYAQQVKHNSSVTMDELGEMRDRAEKAENEALRKLLAEAAEDIEDWGSYASEYFQNKHDLSGNVKKYREAAIKEQSCS